MFSVLRRRKWSVLIPALAVFGLASAAAWLLPRKYESAATIRVERTEIPRDQAETDLAAFARERLRAISYRVLTRERLLGVIERFGLYRDLKGVLPPGEIDGRMRDDIRIAVVGVDAAAPRPGQAGQAAIVFRVSYKGETPEAARRVAGALAALYLDDDIRVRERRWAESRGAAEAGIAAARDKLAAAEEKIVQYRLEHLDSMPDHAQANLQALEELERRIEQAVDDERALKEREFALQSKADTVSPSNPLYDPLMKSLGAVRSRQDAMDRVIRALEKKGAALRRRIEDTPGVEKEYKALEAERESLQAEYEALTGKAAAETAAFELEKSRRGELYAVVEAARLPGWPSRPNIPVILLAGLVLGLGGGIALAAWRDSGDGPFRSPDQAASALPFPVLAAIPVLRAPGELRRRRILRILLSGTALAAIVCLVLFLLSRRPW